MRIVELHTGMYCIKKGWSIFSRFLGVNDNTWWQSNQLHPKAAFDDYEQALQRLNQYGGIK